MRITLEQSLDVANEAINGCMVRLKEITKLHRQLQTENKKLKRQLDCLSSLVIADFPELWENYLEAFKRILEGDKT